MWGHVAYYNAYRYRLSAPLVAVCVRAKTLPMTKEKPNK